MSVSAKRQRPPARERDRQSRPPRNEPGLSRRGSGATVAALMLVVLVLGGLAIASLLKLIPWWLTDVHLGMSLIAFVAYGLDKSKAQRGEWRTPEATLHFFALAGGWPGALMGQRVFRHKTSKVSFQVMFWFIVVLHGAAWTWLIAHRDSPIVKRWLTATALYIPHSFLPSGSPSTHVAFASYPAPLSSSPYRL